MSWQCASEIKSQILYRPTAEVPSGRRAPVACRRRQAKVHAGLAAMPARPAQEQAQEPERAGHSPRSICNLAAARWMECNPSTGLTGNLQATQRRPDRRPGCDLRCLALHLALLLLFALLPCENKWAVESEIDLEPVQQGAARPSRGVREGRGRGCEVISRHREGQGGTSPWPAWPA